jgi:putative DNA primase/helicase
MLTLQQLKAALGGEIAGNQVLCPGPGHSRADRSLAVKPVPGGFVTYSHAGDDWRECHDYVRRRLGLPPWQPGDERHRRVTRQHLRAFDQAEVDREAEERRPRADDEKARVEQAVRIWDDGADPRGTLAERYLNERRKLDLPPDLAVAVLRFHAHCPWRDENTGTTIFVPALIAAFRSIDDDKITAIHRIALNRDGSKIGRRMLGVVHRTAVMLDPAGDVLAIGEGIETCMAAPELGLAPAWALGSVGRVSKFPVLDGVNKLRILGKAGKASADAVDFCVPRWRAAGRQVQIIMPDHPFSDLNDELMKRRKTA